MPTSSAPDSAPRGRTSRSRVVGLLIGWALVLAWLALLGWNIATAGFPAPLSRLIALPSLPWLPLAPALAAQVADSLFALMTALVLLLCALTFAPQPARPAKPALPTATPAAPTPAPPTAAPSAAPAAADSPSPRRGGGQGERARAFTPHVFISHSSHDDAFGKRLAADLRAALAPVEPGRVWYDSAPERGEEAPADAPEDTSNAIAQPGGLRGGMNFPNEIVDQIATRNVMIFIISPAAARSRWVRYEIAQAIDRYNGPERVAVYPVVYRACALPRPLKIFQALDFTRADADPASYQQQLGELLALIQDGQVNLSESAPPFDLGLLPEPSRLIGRDADLKWALERLRAGQTTAVTALRGMGGIGKSALAAVAIRRLREERAFPDGIAVILCENQTNPVEVLRQTLARFTPGGRAPDAYDLPGLTKAALSLEGKRALVVLDNIEPGWPIEQVTKPLVEVGLTLLLTARQMLPTAVVPLADARRLELLSSDDAQAVFAQTFGRDLGALSAGERQAVASIVASVDRHTQAVRLAGAYAAFAASAYHRPLALVAEEIAADVLGIPDDETPRKVEKVLARSVDALSPDDQRLFAALAAFATGEFGRQAALALARGLALAEPETSVDLLVRRALLDATTDTALPTTADAERLRLHPLLRVEATHRLARWDDAEREQADRALAAWYADYTNAVAFGEESAYLALIPDRVNITGALDWALAHGDDRSVALICIGMSRFWRDTSNTRAGLRYLPQGAQAAGRIADQTGERADRRRQANITLYLGDILSNTGRLDDAETLYRQDLDLRRGIEDRRGEGAVLSSLGQVALLRGRLEEAATYFEQSLPIGRETQDRRGEGVDLSNLGQVALRRGRLEEAAAYFEQALVIDRETQDRQGEGAVLSSLGQVALLRGRLEEAAAYFEQALVIRRETQDRQGEGVDLSNLGQVALRRGRLEEAAAYFQQALEVDRETQNKQSEGVEYGYLGQIAEARGQYAEAAQAYRAGIAVLREASDRINIAAILEALGALLLQHSDDRAGGVAAYAEAIALWQAIGLADREQRAREEALALGCRADELPPLQGNAAG